MIYLKYLLMLILGWLFSLIFGTILGVIFGSLKSKIGGFIAGLINSFLTTFVLVKFLAEKNSENTYDILPIILILLPLTLINIQAINNSRKQDATGDYTYGSTGIAMKVNKGLILGTLIGVLTSLFVFTRFSF